MRDEGVVAVPVVVTLSDEVQVARESSAGFLWHDPGSDRGWPAREKAGPLSSDERREADVVSTSTVHSGRRTSQSAILPSCHPHHLHYHEKLHVVVQFIYVLLSIFSFVCCHGSSCACISRGLDLWQPLSACFYKYHMNAMPCLCARFPCTARRANPKNN